MRMAVWLFSTFLTKPVETAAQTKYSAAFHPQTGDHACKLWEVTVVYHIKRFSC